MASELHRVDGPSGPHTSELRRRGRTVGVLRWRQDADDRPATGWYLDGERLGVDTAIDALAADRERDRATWEADANLVGALSTAFALELAEARLGGPHAVTALGGPAARWELRVPGGDPEDLSTAFPALAVRLEGRDAVLTGTLTAEGLADARRRLEALGHVIAGARPAP